MARLRSVDVMANQVERIKARIQVIVEHPFRVIKSQSCHMEVHHASLAKTTANLDF